MFSADVSSLHGNKSGFFCFFLLSVLQHHEMLCEYICTQKPLSMAVETGKYKRREMFTFLLIRKEFGCTLPPLYAVAGVFGDTAVVLPKKFSLRFANR